MSASLRRTIAGLALLLSAAPAGAAEWKVDAIYMGLGATEKRPTSTWTRSDWKPISATR